ncbi:MAG: MBL fold metallo-hydrolase [Acidobacteria bacterium]|nr:MAG: MBL fold metallo-hydrolase [Acidobacteriota bacterium]
MRINVLGSSSAGNSTLVVAGSTRVLIDVGFSARETRRRLAAIGEEASQLSAIIITHEHSDHIRGVPVLARSLGIPVFMSRRTLEAWNALKSGETMATRHFIAAEESFQIGDLTFHPFAVPHDAVETLAFNIEARGVKVGFVTDLGYIPQMVAQRLKGADAIILEANHDLEMLRLGPYPWAVKQRVMSRHGHLSNEEMARFLREDFDGRAEYIMLIHLSQQNNHPEIARLAAVEALTSRGPLLARDAERRVRISYPDRPSEWIEL